MLGIGEQGGRGADRGQPDLAGVSAGRRQNMRQFERREGHGQMRLDRGSGD